MTQFDPNKYATKAILLATLFLVVGHVTCFGETGLPPMKQGSPSRPLWHFAYVGRLRPTAYRSTPLQCKPIGSEWTSIGAHVNSAVVAISQDLLESGILKYHDTICIEGIGCKQVLDCMNKRHRMALDIWVETEAEEGAFDKKYRQKPLKVWVIRLEGEKFEAGSIKHRLEEK